MNLRPYQQEAMDAVLNEWSQGHNKTLLVIPTGGGKTIIFAKITEDCVRNGDRVLIVAHRGELLDQAADKIQKTTGLCCATEKAEQTSSAIDAGLYHPRCKDSHVTYFDGLSDTPDEYTDEEKDELVNQYNAEQRANHAERQAERYGRLADNALDPGDKRAYNARKSEWRKKEVLDNTEKGGNPISSNRVTKSEHDNSERTIESYSNYAKIDIDGIVAALKTSCDEQKLLFSKKSVSEELASSPVGIKP